VSYDDRLGDYNDVASRMREFFEKHPEGRLRPASEWRVTTIGDKAFVVYEAAAYRTDGDPLPGIGTAWEPFPGTTPYTRNSELMNAETSAWGRAILAVGAADTKKGVASREEVQNRQADREQWDEAKPAQVPPERARQNILLNARVAIGQADEPSLTAIGARVDGYLQNGAITDDDAIELRRLIVARRDEIHPADEQAATAEAKP
jgi:hypothetical protein